MRIGLLGEPEDAEILSVQKHVNALGVDTVVVNLRDFPKTTRVSYEVEKGLRFQVNGEDLSDVGAWYVRRYGFTDPILSAKDVTEEKWGEIYGKFREWQAVEGEKNVHVSALLRFLAESAPVINPPEAFIGHNRKPHQVYLIRKAGLPIPDFILSNDLNDLRAFLQRHGRCVYKPLAGLRHVREVTLDLLESRQASLQSEPIMLQALAEGRHIRAYVVGDTVVGAGEIQFDREKSIDYRVTQRGVELLDLPDQVKRDCIAAARACSMPFTGLDVIWDDATGTHKFLECNPSPMFANFERYTGAPVASSLARLLVEAAKGQG
ncbi:MAG TPA: hypothetical protein VNZ52_08115 [Candidatus Thermoplasmatota archaeon]|nr:hypothetical protein [Candidatus Thermoplasmatota archaeon]